MKRTLVGACLFALTLVGIGCVRDPESQPDLLLSGSDSSVDETKKGPARLVPDGYYSFFWEEAAYSGFSLIDKRTGWADKVWTVGFTYGETPIGLAFDLDGSIYTTMNYLSFVPEECYSQFARVDPATGDVTPIGPHFGMNTAGPEIDACGNVYVTGFDVPHLGYVHGDGHLYRVDKLTGTFTDLGYTGMTDWMDLAFDSQGTLWATTQNKLFTLDTQTGAGTFVTDVHGVPDAGEPHNMEVMSIAFDRNDVLYATAMTTFWDDPNGSPAMRIDTATGEATLLGYTHRYYNHGGDTYPTDVKVAHRKGDGYVCITVAIDALPAHLAHGDYVPGTDGHGCDCP